MNSAAVLAEATEILPPLAALRLATC